MKKLIVFFKSRPWSVLLLYWPIHIVWFSIMNNLTMKMNHHVIYSTFDDKIPYISAFVLPYTMWYLYIFSVSLYFLKHDKAAFVRTTVSLHLGNFISMIMCTIYPSVVELRVDVSQPKNIFDRLVGLIYAVDNPAVVFPSMHVIVAILLFLGIRKSRSLGKRRLVVFCGGLLSLLIIMSTVFIKQHSILDVIVGVFVAFVVYTTVYYVID